MSVNTQSNFQLINFQIADFPPITVNQVLYVKYTEDIQVATMRMEVQITDSETGMLSELTGMENVFIRIGDSEGRTEIGGDFVIYDIQDRRNVGGKSSAVLMLCTQDFLNNAANKLSRRFGKGEGKKINDIVEKEILRDLIGVTDNRIAEFEPCVNNFSFVSPYWNPFTAIRWLAAKAIPVPKGSGKNATAGVINIITKKPSFESYGKVSASFGNYNSRKAKAYYTAPLNDSMAYSFNVATHTRDGFAKNAKWDVLWCSTYR